MWYNHGICFIIIESFYQITNSKSYIGSLAKVNWKLNELKSAKYLFLSCRLVMQKEMQRDSNQNLKPKLKLLSATVIFLKIC